MTTRETPFSLCYGIDVVILVELTILTFRIEKFDEASNNELLALKTDLLEERQNHGQVWATTLQQISAQYYTSKFKLRHFAKGDLMFHNAFLNTKELGLGVLGLTGKDLIEFVECSSLESIS